MKRTKSRQPNPQAFGIYQLEVKLVGTEPAVWRRLQVRGDMPLDLLHAVLQVAMGWTNSHLHHFIAGRERFSDPTINGEPEFMDEERDLDERKVTLEEVAPMANVRLIYEYDFGDSWQHTVTVESTGWAGSAQQPFAQCLDGARACPPEDCGGIWGYANLLKVIKHPKHEEYQSMMEWLGGKFDPRAFDLAKTNEFLAKLRWPHTRMTKLAQVLMERDGYRE
jgi:hypothetical protein